MVRHQSFSIKTVCMSGAVDTVQGDKIRPVK